MSVSKKDFRISIILSGALTAAYPAAPVLAVAGACVDGFFLSGSFLEAAKTAGAVFASTILGGAAGGATVSYNNPSHTLPRIVYGGLTGAAIAFAVANADNLPENLPFSQISNNHVIQLG